jgi:hypothetical protein
MTKIGVDFDFNKLNRPATMEEYKASPCASHDKNSEMEEQVHRLQEINKNILKNQAVKAGLISKLDTETIKFDEGKPDFTLIPQEALLELAKVFTKGAQKYGVFNYSHGTDYRRYISASQRHINQWLRGEDIDEIGTNHLANACASIMMVLDNQLTNKGVDDRNKIYKK